MKHIKPYERIPKIGDYVIIDPYTHPIEVEEWILNHIGKIIGIDRDMYIVQYDNIPKGWEGHFSYNDGDEGNIRKTHRFGIEHFAKTKKDLEIFVSQNKFNL